MNDTVDLSNLELLVLARLVGGLKSADLWENVNSNNKLKTIPTSKINTYGLYTNLRKLAVDRGIDIETGIQTNTITTDLVD
tara:strand:+ start:1159 stop:1401 length:243 start_codon:yes stop_codon:yes gene_type:complete